MRELVEHIARALVDEPNRVQVTEVEGERVTIGRIARSIRVILNANATKLGKRAVLEIIE